MCLENSLPVSLDCHFVPTQSSFNSISYLLFSCEMVEKCHLSKPMNALKCNLSKSTKETSMKKPMPKMHSCNYTLHY